MRVGLVTTWFEMCGIAEYSHNLVKYCPEVEFKIITRPYSPQNIRQNCGDCDILNFQYESGFLGIFHPGVMKSFGKPTVLTLHDNHGEKNREIYPFLNEADRVIVHEDTKEGFIHIPQPIVPVKFEDNRCYRILGTAGFPLPHKGFTDLAEATKILVEEGIMAGVRMIAPENPHCDTHVTERRVKEIFPAAEYLTSWNEQEQVIRLLRECQVVVYPYHGAKLGPSAAVRLGIATGRPTVVSDCVQFRDLLEYPDEITFIDGQVTGESIAMAVKIALAYGKRPKRILEDMSWTKAAQMYGDVYSELLKEKRELCA